MLLGKFVKGFVTGGLSGVGVAVSAGVSFSTLEEGKHVLSLLVVAFLSGAVHFVWALYFPAPSTNFPS